MKKILFLFIAFVMSMALFAQQGSTRKHEVQSGETLYSISRQYNVAVAELLKANPGLDSDHMMAGQVINVPVSSQQNVPTALVQQGEGKRQSQQQNLQTGQYESSSQVLATPNRPRFKTLHEVKKKETIFGISRMYGVTEEQLIKANPSIKKGKLKKGTVLNIPYTAEEEAL